MSKSLYSVPVEQRPPATPLGNLNRLLFNVTFPLAMFVMHLAQLASQPLCLHPATHPLYERSATWFKDLFGRLLVVIVMVWAPTTLRITLDRDDKHLSLDGIVQRNETGKAIGLKLPDRMILMANHQVRSKFSADKATLQFSTLAYQGLLRLELHLVCSERETKDSLRSN